MAESTTLRLSIDGMRCAGCVSKVEAALSGAVGVQQATVNLADRTATVVSDSDTMDADLLIAAVQAAGYDATPLVGAENIGEMQRAEAAHVRMLLRRFIIAGLAGLPLFLNLFLHYLPELVVAQAFWLLVGGLTLVVMFYSGRHFYIGAWRAFTHHSATMDTLIATGTGTAWLYSMLISISPGLVPEMGRHAYFDAALIIIALLNLGQALEVRARGKTSQAIRRLIGLQAATARVLRDEEEADIPVAEVIAGD
ncbi:MAG: cation transporter, partial [Mariprofundaceae bacterium]